MNKLISTITTYTWALLLIFVYSNVNAEIKLPAIFSDNMVLQQQSNNVIWGWSSPGKEITIKTDWNKTKYKATSNKDGMWRTQISTPEAGGPYNITISDGKEITLKNVLIGDVWLCAGQSNMEMPMKGFPAQPVKDANDAVLKSTNNQIRLITVPRNSQTTPQTDFKAEWKEANPASVSQFSATGYYFGRLVNQITKVPIGLISVNYGGSCIEAWMSKETSSQFDETPIPAPGDSIKIPMRTPTTLFNGMLNPVIGYGIKGCIWYQGETNYHHAEKYTQQLVTMVAEWRKLWNIGNFPFYFCQIAPYNYDLLTPGKTGPHTNSAYLRDAQLKAVKEIPNSGMAVLLDAGEESNIHPADKIIPGERLAYQALAKTYGIEGFGYDSPTVNEVSIKDSTVTINFNNTPTGITAYNKPITLFEVAGEDRKFYPATVTLRRKSIVVSAPEVKQPVAVRYAFKNFVEAELFNTEGLPMPSFRTDDWPIE